MCRGHCAALLKDVVFNVRAKRAAAAAAAAGGGSAAAAGAVEGEISMR